MFDTLHFDLLYIWWFLFQCENDWMNISTGVFCGFYFNQSDVTFAAMIRGFNGGHEGIKEFPAVICFLDHFSPKVEARREFERVRVRKNVNVIWVRRQIEQRARQNKNSPSGWGWMAALTFKWNISLILKYTKNEKKNYFPSPLFHVPSSFNFLLWGVLPCYQRIRAVRHNKPPAAGSIGNRPCGLQFQISRQVYKLL